MTAVVLIQDPLQHAEAVLYQIHLILPLLLETQVPMAVAAVAEVVAVVAEVKVHFHLKHGASPAVSRDYHPILVLLWLYHHHEKDREGSEVLAVVVVT